MSITFTPAAGTVTTFNYYGTEGTHQMPGDDVANGVIRFSNEEPSVQASNSNAYWLLEQLGLYDGEDTYTGEVEAESVDNILATCQASIIKANSEYAQRKLAEMRDMLLHCKYHACGFYWG